MPWLEAKSSDTAKVKCLDLRLGYTGERKSNEVKESLFFFFFKEMLGLQFTMFTTKEHCLGF